MLQLNSRSVLAALWKSVYKSIRWNHSGDSVAVLAAAAAVWTAEGEMLAVAGWWREDHYVRVLPGEAEGKGE